MLIDKNGKLFGKINIIDLLVILLIIGAGVGFGMRFFSSAAEDVRSKTKLTYVVEIGGLRIYSIDALQKKGVVLNSKTKDVIGEITDVSAEVAKTQVSKADGTIDFAENPDKYTVKITISADGRETDRSYFVGENMEVSVGASVGLSTKYISTSGKIVSVTKE